MRLVALSSEEIAEVGLKFVVGTDRKSNCKFNYFLVCGKLQTW
jgi:uncharacterized protein (UPF0179 family)